MAEGVYVLCALTSVLCAALLFRGYRRHKRTSLLFWSSLCFAGLAINNVLLFLDQVMLPQVPLGLWRTCAALFSLVVLLFGLVWESR